MNACSQFARPWRRCKPGMIRRVDFALGSAAVRLVSTFIYPRSRDGCCEGGRVYEVVDVRTGRGDVVGVEFLQRL